jgi:glyceraldehyde-3-phosphate dehydrogenase/erythrose-4-phosphate dehydrogenase
MKRIAIKGLGRIGRRVLRHVISDMPQNHEIAAINAPTPVDQFVYVIRYDSVHGRAPSPVETAEEPLRIGSREIVLLSDRIPAHLLWNELDTYLVSFTDRDDAAQRGKGKRAIGLSSQPGIWGRSRLRRSGV